MSGQLEEVAEARDEFNNLVEIPENRDKWFMPAVVEESITAGMLLQRGECYSLDVPLYLGGQLVLDNLKPTDLSVHLSVNGQILGQVRDLPDGTPISKIKIKMPKGRPLFKRLFGYITGR